MFDFVAKMEKQSPNETGLVYAFLSTICFFTMQTFAKLFKNTVHFSQIGFIRGMVLFCSIYLLAKSQKQELYQKDQFWFMTFRSVLGYQTTLGLYWGVTKIPISQNTMLLQVAPIFVPLVDRIIYKTVYTFKEILLALVAICGVYMVIAGKETQINQEEYVQGYEKFIVVLILFCSITLGYSFSAVMVKEVKHVNPFVININYALVGSMTSVLIQISSERYEISIRDFGLLIITVGFVGFFSQHFFIKAYQLAKPGRASIINCMNIIYAFLLEIIFYHEYPSPVQVIGAIMSISCVIISLRQRI